MSTEQDFRTLIKKQIEEELIYGCVVMAGNRKKDFLLEAYGTADRVTQKRMDVDSIFDLASITKPVGCATLAVICQENGLLNLDHPFTNYLPKHRAFFEQPPTIRQLGAHISGIDYDRPYDRFQAVGGEKLVDAFYDLAPVAQPGRNFVYSCSNYLLLGLIVESVSGLPLQTLAKEKIFQPLGMSDTEWGMPRPDQMQRVVRAHLVTTHGTVALENLSEELLCYRKNDCLPSDETAQGALPHRVGNAGLFSTASDLARFARMMLEETPHIFNTQTRNELFRCCTPPSLHRRSFGWDMELIDGFSEATIHHSGWSGQGLWIDPENDCFFIMLTNRNSTKYDECKLMRRETARAMNKFLVKHC